MFLDEHIMDPKFEFYLPHALDQAIRDDGATVKVLRTAGDWFGVTNPDDKKICQQMIQEKVDTGVYPSSLWVG